jgi:hypothetical protein
VHAHNLLGCVLFTTQRLGALQSAAGKLAEDEKQKVKVQRVLIAMGAQPEEFEKAPEQEADDGAVAANGLPDESAPPLSAADGGVDGDVNMDVDMDAGMCLHWLPAVIAATVHASPTATA